MSETVCRECGAEMEYDWAPCPNCGWKMPGPWEEPDDGLPGAGSRPGPALLSKPRRWIRWTAWLVLSAALALLLAWLERLFR